MGRYSGDGQHSQKSRRLFRVFKTLTASTSESLGHLLASLSDVLGVRDGLGYIATLVVTSSIGSNLKGGSSLVASSAGCASPVSP